MDTIYYPTYNVSTGDLCPIFVGEYLPAPYSHIKFDPINVVDGKQLLAHFTGRHVCEGVLHLVTLFGEQHICKGDTMEYYTASDMEHYSFSIKGTAGGYRIPLEGEEYYHNYDSVARFVFPQAGIDTILVRYHTNTDELLIGHTLNYTSMAVNVYPQATQDEIIVNDATVCYSTAAELTASAPLVTNPIFRWYASQTATSYLYEGETFTTNTLTANTDYYVSVDGDNYCENYTDTRAKVTVTVKRVVPTITIATTTPTVCTETSVTFTATTTNGGTNPSYQWRVNGASVAGNNNYQYTYIPKHGDVVTCMLTSNAECANPASVYASNATMTVLNYPAVPDVITETLDAYPGSEVNLMSAVVNPIAGISYSFYENPDKTGKLPSSFVVFDLSKDDYYVAANNGYCEGTVSQIILKIPCPETAEDIDGNIYKVTPLGGLCWTDNLRAITYTSTGAPISIATTYTCAGCPLQLDTLFGLLYDWYSAVGDDTGETVQGICPDGYHIPSKAEWCRLERYSAYDLKSDQHWLIPPGSGTDKYGFGALPAGSFAGASDRFIDLYGFAGWWSKDDNGNDSTAGIYYITYYCDIIKEAINLKIDRLSVRCVMDY
jgi:uncharacterized protein (TIGR02145 family)